MLHEKLSSIISGILADGNNFNKYFRLISVCKRYLINGGAPCDLIKNFTGNNRARIISLLDDLISNYPNSEIFTVPFLIKYVCNGGGGFKHNKTKLPTGNIAGSDLVGWLIDAENFTLIDNIKPSDVYVKNNFWFPALAILKGEQGEIRTESWLELFTRNHEEQPGCFFSYCYQSLNYIQGFEALKLLRHGLNYENFFQEFFFLKHEDAIQLEFMRKNFMEGIK